MYEILAQPQHNGTDEHTHTDLAQILWPWLDSLFGGLFSSAMSRNLPCDINSQANHQNVSCNGILKIVPINSHLLRVTNKQLLLMGKALEETDLDQHLQPYPLHWAEGMSLEVDTSSMLLSGLGRTLEAV